MSEPKNIIVIPKDAKLEDVIMMLNLMKLCISVDSKDPLFHKWLNEHKHWITTGQE